MKYNLYQPKPANHKYNSLRTYICSNNNFPLLFYLPKSELLSLTKSLGVHRSTFQITV